MYCMYCGNKIDENYNVCPNCGAILKDNNINISNNNFINNANMQNQIYVQKTSNWKDTVSIVCAAIGLYFCYVVFVSYEEILIENIELYSEYPVSSTFGCLSIQIIFATVALILGLIAKKANSNKKNKIGIILSLIIYAISIAQFIMILSWF